MPVLAQPATDEDGAGDFFQYEDDVKTEEEQSWFSFLDIPEHAVSTQLRDFVQGVDEFFANEKAFYTSSGSYIRLSMDAVWNEGGDTSTAGDVRLRVRFPLTQGKLKLLLESDPVETQELQDRRLQATPATVTEDNTYYAGVQADVVRESGWSLAPSIGIRLRSPLDPYVRLRASRNYQLDDNDLLAIYGAAYWFDSSGAGYDGLVEFNHQLEANMLGRSSSFVRWTAETNYFELSQVFSAIHTLSPRRALTWSAGVYGNSDPMVHATDYLLAVRYRQALYKNFFFMELSPELRFQKENEFKDEFSLFFRLELFFQG